MDHFAGSYTEGFFQQNLIFFVAGVFGMERSLFWQNRQSKEICPVFPAPLRTTHVQTVPATHTCQQVPGQGVQEVLGTGLNISVWTSWRSKSCVLLLQYSARWIFYWTYFGLYVYVWLGYYCVLVFKYEEDCLMCQHSSQYIYKLTVCTSCATF